MQILQQIQRICEPSIAEKQKAGSLARRHASPDTGIPAEDRTGAGRSSDRYARGRGTRGEEREKSFRAALGGEADAPPERHRAQLRLRLGAQETPSAESVLGPSSPVAGRPEACWKRLTASCVDAPY